MPTDKQGDLIWAFASERLAIAQRLMDGHPPGLEYPATRAIYAEFDRLNAEIERLNNDHGAAHRLVAQYHDWEITKEFLAGEKVIHKLQEKIAGLEDEISKLRAQLISIQEPLPVSYDFWKSVTYIGTERDTTKVTKVTADPGGAPIADDIQGKTTSTLP